MTTSQHNSTSQGPVATGHEADTANATGIAWAVAGLSLLAVIGIVVVWGIIAMLSAAIKPSAAVPPALADEPSVATPLDANQPAALRKLRSYESERLSGYGWVDREADIARIPIKRALDIVRELGLPDWKSNTQPSQSNAVP